MIQSINVTINYLKYASIIEIEIFDQNFDKITPPSININFRIFQLLRAENSNEILSSFLYEKRCITLEKLYEIYFENCDQITPPTVYINFDHSYLQDYYNQFMTSGQCIKGSLIQILSQSKLSGLTFNYFAYNQGNISLKNSLIGNYVEKRNFFQLYTNLTANSRIPFKLIIVKDFDRLTSIEVLSLRKNNEFFLLKKSFEFLEFPYKSKCSYYNSLKKPFNSSNQKHCIRQCIRYYCEIKLNCSCFGLDNKVYETDHG